MKKTLALLFFTSCFLAAQAQKPTVSATLDTNYILIGQQTTLHLKAENLSKSSELIWAMWPDTLKGVELLSASRDTFDAKGEFRIEEHFVLTSFDSGFVVIPPFSISYDGEQYETEPLILNVGTVPLNPDQDYFDIKEPVKAPFDFLYWLKRLWIVWLILVAILGIVLWLILRKKKEKAAAPPEPVDLRSPAQRAKEELLAVRDGRIWQDGNVKLYYSRVSDIVRTYLEESLHVPAMEMISDELIDAMQSRISAESQSLLEKMLRLADQVKFAKAKPGPDKHAQIWDDAMKIVALTEPKIVDNEG